MTKHTSEMNNSNYFKQPEALHLADYLEFSHRHAEHSPEFIAAAELRRLYAEVDRLSYQLAYPDNFERQPLTDEELYKVFPAIAAYHEANKTLYRSIARAIEAAHGIKTGEAA